MPEISTGPAPYLDVPPYESVSSYMNNSTSARRDSIVSHKSVSAGSILDFFRPLSTVHSEVDDEDHISERSPLLQAQLRADPSFDPDLISSYPSKKDSLAQIKRMVSHSTIRHVMDTGSLPELETTVGNEVQTLAKYSVPLVITFLLQYSLNVASVFSVGRIGSSELAAVSLAGMTANITGYCLFQGTSTSLDTLCAQSFGRRDYRSVGLHFMRCTIFLLLIDIPVTLIWTLASRPILTFIVDDVRLVNLAVSYLRVLSIGLPAFILFETLKRFLQAQNIFHASTYVILVAAPFNAFLNYYLVWGAPKLGFIGAPIAIVSTNYLMAILLLLYTVFVDGYRCWCGFSTDLLRHWSKMVYLSVNGCVGVISEWLAFEIATLSAARFGTVSLASQSVIATICVLLYQVPFAVSIAASTRVANYIGAASTKSSITASNGSIIVSLIIGVMNALILTFFKDNIIVLFTDDVQVIELSEKIIPLAAIYQISDCVAAVTGGVLRGQGRQKMAALCTLVSYYLISLPIGFWLAFWMGMELFGLWAGLCIAIIIISLLQLASVLQSDWEHIIHESMDDALEESHCSNEIRSVISTGIDHIASI